MSASGAIIIKQLMVTSKAEMGGDPVIVGDDRSLVVYRWCV